MPTGSDFSRVDFGKQQDDYRQRYQDSATGEFDPQAPGTVPESTVEDTRFIPAEISNFQFSSKMSGDPKELAQNARQGVEAHASILEAYGYNMPLATMGTHPWLRDGLADASQKEPGNGQPVAGAGIPGEKP
jgi:hypothetical protein